MYTYQQRLEYAHRLQMLQRAVVIKDNIHLTYQYKNRNKAHANIDSVQDRINKAIIDDAVNGNGESIKDLDKQGEKLIHDTLTNERKRLHRDKNHKAVNQATKSNSQYYTNIFNYRRKKIGESLSDKIENELRSDALKDLSDTDKIKHLQEKFDGHGTKRLKNIVTDAMHTNESNIGWIKAVEDGFNYKVWKNGRVAKGRTRAWHKEKIISAVPIDETFDIYGSYLAHMMYPGDLNGGAENVANCRCWLLYTNRVPSNLRSKTVFNVSPTFQDIWDNARKPAGKLKTTFKKPFNKLKELRNKLDNKFKSYNKASLRLNPVVDDEISSFQKRVNRLRYGRNSRIVKYKNITIIQQEKAYYTDIPTLKRGYDMLPKSKRKYVKQIVIHNKSLGEGIQGAVVSLNSSVIHLYPSKYRTYNYDEVICHEFGHVYDNRHIRFYSISKSLKWLRAVRKDIKYIKQQGLTPPYDGFVSPYAKSGAKEHKFLIYRKYSEDFAESVRLYTTKRQYLQRNFPNRYKILNEIFGD